MIEGRKLVVVMPAYNAEKTLMKTYQDLPHEIVDEVILVDDYSSDATVEIARRLNATVVCHPYNQGYGANQKTCYTVALEKGADIVVMVHPDYQYSPRLCGAMAWMIASGEYDAVLASRVLGNGALAGGMPWWRFLANRFLTAAENLMLGVKYSEFHSGYRAFSREILSKIPLLENSDDFVFDNQLIAQVAFFGYRVGEISCPTRYMAESSSINFLRSCVYGLGVLWTAISFRASRMGFWTSPIFQADGRALPPRLACPRRDGNFGGPRAASPDSRPD